MISTTVKQSHSFQQISKLLEARDNETPTDSINRTRASVAMILRQAADDTEILFIQRAADDQDPWSGHIAFPGGKLEEGELVCQTARRETQEEIGIDLDSGYYLGRLSDIIGTNLPVRVSCCVFGVDSTDFVPKLSDEVSDVFWIGLTDLRDDARHLLADVAFSNRRLEVPAITIPCEGKPVLWGITYRLLMQFIGLLEHLDSGISESADCSMIPHSIELEEKD